MHLSSIGETATRVIDNRFTPFKMEALQGLKDEDHDAGDGAPMKVVRRLCRVCGPPKDNFFGVIFGAGVALVVLPLLGFALFLRHHAKADTFSHAVELPILAILGILALFGALSLVSSLFSRLKMSDRTQALGLPEGSIRAAIALSLIVLFAIIAIMLFQSARDFYSVAALTEGQKNAFVAAQPDRVIAAIAEPCPDAAPGPASLCYRVLVAPPVNPESAELGKQLLILIGTLMTSVTSFYFAARTLEQHTKRKKDLRRFSPEPPDQNARSDAGQQHDLDEEAIDACGIEGGSATPDHELPPSRGGVA